MGDLDPALKETHYPFQKLLGFEMTGWSTDYARFEMPLTGDLMNRYGIPHGGIYAALLDTVMGFSGCYTGDPERKVLAMTLSMTTNFLSRPDGKLLIGEGRRTGGGRSSFFAEGTIHDETGTLLTTATGVFRYRKAF
ncbi:hotdog fold thioesterase [Stappia sp. GBMRC 2046]|uniref:Hotdog fold thioesterase n=1 Tax=Stappia sediminis TaxID=2692190 RepID=A0A7X3S929_9HYPH|nr:PaaI family thioesterase [Stappia sediminis]MXN66345.1 hotdog fold thioesterase [Stappia sediminis]